MAADLEPLLRTAADVSLAFGALSPPSYLLERGRLRFVAASSDRRRAREIAGGVRGFTRARLPWNFRHWGMLGSGVAAALALVLVGAVALMTGDGRDGGSTVSNPSPTSAQESKFVQNLEDLRIQLNRTMLKKATQGRVSPEDLEKLRDAADQLRNSGLSLDDDTRQKAEDVLSEQYVFVGDLVDEVPVEQVPQVQDVLSTTTKAANDLGIDIPTSAPSPVATGQPTPTPAQTPTPTDTPVPTAPMTETPVPTEAPTPTPTPPLQGVE
jgi:hypothetical protein